MKLGIGCFILLIVVLWLFGALNWITGIGSFVIACFIIAFRLDQKDEIGSFSNTHYSPPESRKEPTKFTSSLYDRQPDAETITRLSRKDGST